MISIGPVKIDLPTPSLPGSSVENFLNLGKSALTDPVGTLAGAAASAAPAPLGGLVALAQGAASGGLTAQEIKGPGLEVIGRLLGIEPPSGAAAQVVLDEGLKQLRQANKGIDIISSYLEQRIQQGRDLDPNANVEKRFPTGSVAEFEGRAVPFLEPSEIKSFGYHYGMGEEQARNYVGTNELADFSVRKAFPALAGNASAIETIGQAVNAQLNPAVSFAQIENWRAEAQDIASDPVAQRGGFADVLRNNYSNLFAQQDQAIGSVLTAAGVGSGGPQERAAAFSQAFQAFRTSPEGKDLPRGEQMERFVERFIEADGDPKAMLRDMHEKSRDNLVQSARSLLGR